MPLTGTRGVECRSSTSLGAGNYTMVFTFANNLVSVDSATVPSGAATVSSTAAGPNANQYTVNLTGVADAQYVAVALVNAKDSTGAIGTVTGPQWVYSLATSTVMAWSTPPTLAWLSRNQVNP